jgi:hypothetical protein
VKTRLGLAEREPLVFIRRLVFLEGVPLTYILSFLPYALGDRVTLPELERRPLSAFLARRYRLPIRRAVQTIQPAIADVDAIVTTGGTGLTSRDSTFEAIDALLTKRLPGFGELFRMLSYEEIGSAAMMSRACAGTIGKVVVVSLPGSEKAVRLAMTKLVIPELAHLVQQATK